MTAAGDISHKLAARVDALVLDLRRALVQEAIEDHLPEHRKALKAAEKSERTLIRQLVDG